MRPILLHRVVAVCACVVVGLVAAGVLLDEPAVGRGTAMSAGRVLMATGKIAANHEALYVFDQVTGKLYCYEIREDGKGVDLRGATRNCLKDLELSTRDLAKARFAMVTGQFDKNTDAVFLTETNRGRIAAYRFEDADRGVSLVGRASLVRDGR